MHQLVPGLQCKVNVIPGNVILSIHSDYLKKEVKTVLDASFGEFLQQYVGVHKSNVHYIAAEGIGPTTAFPSAAVEAHHMIHVVDSGLCRIVKFYNLGKTIFSI